MTTSNRNVSWRHEMLRFRAKHEPTHKYRNARLHPNAPKPPKVKVEMLPALYDTSGSMQMTPRAWNEIARCAAEMGLG